MHREKYSSPLLAITLLTALGQYGRANATDCEDCAMLEHAASTRARVFADSWTMPCSAKAGGGGYDQCLREAKAYYRGQGFQCQDSCSIGDGDSAQSDSRDKPSTTGTAQSSAVPSSAGRNSGAALSNSTQSGSTGSTLSSPQSGGHGGDAATDRYGRSCISVVRNASEPLNTGAGAVTYHEIVVHNNCNVPVIVQFVRNSGQDFGTWQLPPGGDFKSHCSDGDPSSHDCHGYKGYLATFPRN